MLKFGVSGDCAISIFVHFSQTMSLQLTLVAQCVKC